MAELNKELENMLAHFLVCEIGSKAIDGITYSMVIKDMKDNKKYKEYMSIRKKANDLGFSAEEVFRVYEVANGFIFDMDLNTAKSMTYKLAKQVSDTIKEDIDYRNIIGDLPEQRRKKDIVNLAKFVQSKYNEGIDEVEVALFSRNSTNKIIVNGIGPKGERLGVKYNAYAIRHWDIELVNEKFLIPAGFRIRRIQPCEVLPSKTGVSFILTLETL